MEEKNSHIPLIKYLLYTHVNRVLFKTKSDDLKEPFSVKILLFLNCFSGSVTQPGSVPLALGAKMGTPFVTMNSHNR